MDESVAFVNEGANDRLHFAHRIYNMKNVQFDVFFKLNTNKTCIGLIPRTLVKSLFSESVYASFCKSRRYKAIRNDDLNHYIKTVCWEDTSKNITPQTTFLDISQLPEIKLTFSPNVGVDQDAIDEFLEVFQFVNGYTLISTVLDYQPIVVSQASPNHISLADIREVVRSELSNLLKEEYRKTLFEQQSKDPELRKAVLVYLKKRYKSRVKKEFMEKEAPRLRRKWQLELAEQRPVKKTKLMEKDEEDLFQNLFH